MPIFQVVRLYNPDGSNVDLCRKGMILNGAVMARPGTPGAELVDALKPGPDILLNPSLLLAGGFQEI